MSVTVVVTAWRGKKIYDMLKSTMRDRMKDLGQDLETKVKGNIATPYPPSGPPGGFPAKRTGQLHDAITHEVHPSESILRVGVATNQDCPHAVAVELGTPNTAPRPFLRNTLHQEKKRITDRLGKKIHTGVGTRK